MHSLARRTDVSIPCFHPTVARTPCLASDLSVVRYRGAPMLSMKIATPRPSLSSRIVARKAFSEAR